MFRLPTGIPSNSASIDELTDFLECECLRSKRERIAITNIIAPILIGSDEIEFDGIDDDSDRLLTKADEILTEIDRRREAANGNYPFQVQGKGIALKSSDDKIYWTYCYLLFCTRFNMQTHRTLAGIDGTMLFERFSAFIASKGIFWG